MIWKREDTKIQKWNVFFKKLLLLTGEDEVCSNSFTTPPIIAYNKHKNIGDWIIGSKLKVNVTPTDELRLISLYGRPWYGGPYYIILC